MWVFGVALQARIPCTKSARESLFGYLLWGCLKCTLSDAPILGLQNHFCWQIGCRGMRAWGATPKPHIFWHCALQTPSSYVSKNTLAGIFGAEVCAPGAPRQKATFFGIAQCKHPHARYPKTLLQADLVQRYRGTEVQRYARLKRHANRPHFLALCISNTPILGIQKHFGGYIWYRGMRAWSATPNTHVFWHCAFQTPPY